jgi:ADP-ribose pyrophosphatase
LKISPDKAKIALVEKLLSTQQIYHGRAVKLHIDTIKKPSGRITTREVVEHSDCVVIIPIDTEGNLLLVRQFRYAVGKELLELPAGGINPGESAEQAARRELQEEIGYLPRQLEKLGGFYSAPGYCNEYLHLYLATELIPSQLWAEDTESISLVRVPPEDLTSLISRGEITDAKSLAGLLYLLQRLRP